MIIALDFDGTCLTHFYPLMGRNIGAVPVLKRVTDNNHKLILWTMRSGKELKEAARWFKLNGIPLYASQTNPTQFRWTESPKAFAHLYIDDAGLGIPLTRNYQKGEHSFTDKRPFVDWNKVETLLEEKGII